MLLEEKEKKNGSYISNLDSWKIGIREGLHNNSS